jgi:protease I
LLAEAGILSGKTVTSWPSIRTDLVNAGANWVDQEVAEDGNIITSRKPDDLEAFSKTILVQMEQQS